MLVVIRKKLKKIVKSVIMGDGKGYYYEKKDTKRME